ncbi:hypothetical protein TPDSL_34680 [Terrisporobacter petrolearius]
MKKNYELAIDLSTGKSFNIKDIQYCINKIVNLK